MTKRKYFKKGELVWVLWRSDGITKKILDPPIQIVGMIVEPQNLLQVADVYIQHRKKIFKRVSYSTLEPIKQE